MWLGYHRRVPCRQPFNAMYIAYDLGDRSAAKEMGIGELRLAGLLLAGSGDLRAVRPGRMSPASRSVVPARRYARPLQPRHQPPL